MFERFTNQSRRVVVLAQEEARMLGHNYIGAEHLLLGLISEGQGLAARVLSVKGVTLDAARDQVVTATGRGQGQPTGHVPFTAAAKKSFELSLAEANALESHHIGTGHLLLGLLREGDNAVLQVLGAFGADPGDLRTEVIRELREHPEQDSVTQPGWVAQPQLTGLLRDTLPELLATIEQRLAAIERHLDITPGAEPDQESGNHPAAG